MDTNKEEKGSSSSFYMPESLVENIFSWLPTESLIRFKLVSRWWNSLINGLINDPDFVSKHLHNAKNKINSSSSFSSLYLSSIVSNKEHLNWSSIVSNKAPLNLGYLVPAHLKTLTVKYYNDENDDDENVIDKPIRCSTGNMKLLLPFTKDVRRLHLVMGSQCNGLICLFDAYWNDVYLCNPAINESRIISPSLRYHSHLFDTVSLGLGFDSKAKDYKIIRIEGIPHRHPTIATLYTLGSNSWKEIKDKDNLIRKCLFLSGVGHYNKHAYHKQVYYWLVSYVDQPEENFIAKQTIISFDFCEEEFSLIQLPQEIDQNNGYWNCILVWNEHIAVFCNCYVESKIEMWVMMDGCFDSAGWAKHVVIDQLPPGSEILNFWKNDELLIRYPSGRFFYFENKVISYNIVTRKRRELSFGAESYLGSLISYVKSLVSVKGTQRDVQGLSTACLIS